MSGSGRPALGAALLASLLALPAQERALLLDGSLLHGELRSLSLEEGLVWEHPHALEPFGLPLDRLDSIRFPPRQDWRGGEAAQCRFRFVNGDEIYGRLLSMDRHRLELECHFGGPFRADRSQVESLTFLLNGYRVLYEGPNSLEEWTRGQSPNDWTYWDGALCAENRGIIGRHMGLEDSASLSFDLEWQDSFYLTVILHTSSVDRHDYQSGAYLFSLRPGSVSLQRIQPGSGTVQLGSESLDVMSRTRKARFEMRTHRQSATFALLADGRPAASWKDPRGFVATGDGVVFSLWGSNSRSKVSLSRILVTEWDGAPEALPEEEASGPDKGLLLVNQDRPSGQVLDMEEGRLRFHLRGRKEVAIPMERIRRIQLNPPRDPPPSPEPGSVRIGISGGGRLTLSLEELDRRRVRGHNRTFGPVAIETGHIRLMELNLDHPLRAGEGSPPPFPFLETR